MDRELDVSEVDLLAELEQLLIPEGEGFSAKELAKRCNCNAKTVLGKLHKFADEGRLIVSQRQGVSITGKRKWIPVYRLRSKEELTQLQIIGENSEQILGFD